MSWPATFGDTTAEYVAAHDEGGFVAGQAALLWATGPDAVRFLQDIITQEVAGLAVGDVARSLLLEPRGKLDATMWVLRDETRVGMLTDTDQVEHLQASLTKWRFRVDVEFEVDTRAAFDVVGPGGSAIGPERGWAEENGVLTAVLPDRPIPHRVVIGASEADLTAAGLRPIGDLVMTALRIEMGEPRMNVDIDHKTIPQEAGLVDESVSFTKGCYLGQELVARIDSRGHVNRHLRGLRLHDAVIPPTGADVRLGDDIIGSITSVGESLAVRAPVAMAMIRREAEPGSTVEIGWDGGSASATVESFPLV